MATLTPTQAQLLIEPNFAVVATVGKKGEPQSTVVWIDWDGENAVFNTRTVRAKGGHLARDPRISIAVWDRNDPYRSLELQGRAELDFEGADEHIAALARKYGRETYTPGDRVIVRVRPERVHTYGLDQLFERTGSDLWLERARAFAMHAIAQVEQASDELGRGRWTLSTGDRGTAFLDGW